MKDVDLGILILDLVNRVKQHGQISEEVWRKIDLTEPNTTKALELLGKRMAPGYEHIGRMARAILKEAANTSEQS